MQTLFTTLENKSAVNSNNKAIKDFFAMEGDGTAKHYTEFLNELLSGYTQSQTFKELTEESKNVADLMFDFKQLVMLVSTLQNPLNRQGVCSN